MKVILFLFLTFLTFNVFGQSESGQIAETSVGVEKIHLAKDEAGKAGEETATFSTTDIPIYCIIKLDSLKSVIVKMNFIAVNVPGVKPETKVITVSYKTDGREDQVNFTGKPEKLWTAGSYRIDIFIDGKAAANKEFEIRKALNGAQKANSVAVKNLIQPKQRTKTVLRVKKNQFAKN